MNKKFATAKPFLFETSFDDQKSIKLTKKKNEDAAALAAAQEAARVEAAVPPPPSFSEEELATARTAAFEEGRQAGLTEANSQINNQTNAHLQLITAQLAVLHDKQQLANETHAATLAQITGEILSKLLPFYAQSNGAEEIITFVRDCLSPILDDSRVIIRLAEDIKEHLSDQLNQVGEEAGFEGRLRIIGDASIGLSDAKVEWDGGSAERNWDDIWLEINDAIKHATHLANTMQDEMKINEPTIDSEPSALEKIVANAGDIDDPSDESEGEGEIVPAIATGADEVLTKEDEVPTKVVSQVPPTETESVADMTSVDDIAVVKDPGSGDQNGG